MAGALERFRVVEFADHIAGQVLGMFLADQGAEVVKVEPPGGDPMRGHAVFRVWNRGKKSIVLDPARMREPPIVEQLIATANVLIDDQTPAVADRARPSYDRYRRLNPGLVYVSLPAFGDEHPDRGAPPSEPIVSAQAGVYQDRSPDASGGPQFVAVPYATIFGAMTAAPAVTAALLHWERTGEGQLVRVPLYDAMFGAVGFNITMDPGADPFRGGSIAIGRNYRCKDGRWVNINATSPRALRPLLGAAGHPDWYDPLMDTAHLTDNPDERQQWKNRFTRMWTARSAQEWEAVMDEAGVPCTMCRTADEWIDSAPARASGAVIRIDDASYGPMRQAGIQVRLSENPGLVAGPAPGLGQHTDDVIASLSASPPAR